MAQKIFPRSLRASKMLSPNFAFYAENTYANRWAQIYEFTMNLFAWSQKNLLYKIKRKAGSRKRPSKKQKMQSFTNSRFLTSNWMGTVNISPILFKLAHHSFVKKYSPIQAMRKIRRSTKKRMHTWTKFKKHS